MSTSVERLDESPAEPRAPARPRQTTVAPARRRSRLLHIFAIARNTFREASRDKILYSLLFFAVLLILFAVALGQLSLHEETRLIRDMGLGGISLFSVIIAIFVGSSLVYKELDRKTVFTIIPKPLARHEFIIGKFAGMTMVLAVQLAIMTAVLCAVLWAQGAPPDDAIAKAVVLLLCEVVVVTSVALLFSSFSTPFLSAFFTLGVFVLGRSTPEIKAVAPKVGAARPLLEGIARLVPDLHLFYVSGAMLGGERVSINEQYVDWSYVASAAGYAIGYAAILVCLSAIIFRRRDFV